MLSSWAKACDWAEAVESRGDFCKPLITLLISCESAGVEKNLCLFETKEYVHEDAYYTTYLGYGREPCQRQLLNFLGECLASTRNTSLWYP